MPPPESARIFTFTGPPAERAGYPAPVRFGVLGAVTVVDDGGPRRLSGPARRRLLAALLARAPHPVATDTLIDDLWGDAPPATADKTLQSHVLRLRDDLGRDDSGSPILTEPGGYRLAIDPSAIDAWCFERDFHNGRAQLTEGDPDAASALLTQATSWWRGDAYAEFPEAAFAVHERIRLSEMRLQCQEALTDACLAQGAAGDLVADLDLRTRQHPYRERSWEQLVTALYRDGQQADALSAYRRARDLLAEDLGVDPSPGLRDLEQRILTHDPALAAARHGATVLPLMPTAVTTAQANGVALAPAVTPAGQDETPDLRLAAVSAHCPYPGLAAFHEDDTDIFVGRERLTAEIAGRLADNDFVVLVGPSGAGKSSLLRAGVIPALRAGAIPGSAGWRIRVITTGSARIPALHPATDLLVIDQAEELFTLLDADDRRDVGHRLGELLAAGTRLLLVLRGDYYGRLAELDAFTSRVGAATVLVGPMTEDETRRAVVEPAARCGVTVTSPLVDDILSDMRGRTGALPLLSAAMREAWEERTGDVLTEMDYRAVGGVGGALQGLADKTYTTLDPQAQAAARRLLLHCVTVTAGSWARRPVTLEAASLDGDPATARALDALVTARIVTISDTCIELTHEALLTAWPRLQTWLDERATVATQLEHLADAAARWHADGRPDADLLRGARLQAGLDWLDRHPDDLSNVERDYLQQSQDHVDQAFTVERRRRRRLTSAVAGLAAALLIAATVTGVAAHEKSNADTAAADRSAAALRADAGRLAALTYTASDIQTSLLLATAAYRLQDTPDSRGALLSADQRGGGALRRVQVPNRVLFVGASPDGSRILTMDNTRLLRTYDAGTLTQTAAVQLTGDVTGGESPDGRNLIMCHQNNGAPGAATLVDPTSGNDVRTLHPTTVELGFTRCAAFTGDGAHLVVLEATGPNQTDKTFPDTIAVFPTNDWAHPVTVRPSAPVVALSIGLNTFAVQLADGTLQIRDAATLAVLHSAVRSELVHACPDPAAACGIALSPNGKLLEVLEPQHQQEPLVVATSDLAGTGVTGQGLPGAQNLCVFSPDSTRLACGGDDSSLLVLNTADGSTITAQPGDGSPMLGMAWTGAGTSARLYTGGLDRQLVSWNLRTIPPDVRMGPVVPADDENAGAASTFMVGTRINGSRIYALNLATGRSVDWPTGAASDEQGEWILPSPHGSRGVYATAGPDGTAHVRAYDLRTGAVLYDRSPGRWLDENHSLSASFGADDTQLLVQTAAATFDEVDLRTATITRTITVAGTGISDLYAIPYGASPHGQLVMLAQSLADGSSTNVLVLVDPVTGKVTARSDLPDFPSALAFSPDGRTLAVGTYQGGLSTVDAGTLATRVPNVVATPGFTLTVSWSPDSSTLATTGTNGFLTLWNAATLTSLGTPTQLAENAWVWAWYQPDGSIAGVVPGPNGSAGHWFTMPGTPAAWAAEACAQAGRDLTPAEWGTYIPDQPYRATCPHP